MPCASKLNHPLVNTASMKRSTMFNRLDLSTLEAALSRQSTQLRLPGTRRWTLEPTLSPGALKLSNSGSRLAWHLGTLKPQPKKRARERETHKEREREKASSMNIVWRRWLHALRASRPACKNKKEVIWAWGNMKGNGNKALWLRP